MFDNSLKEIRRAKKIKQKDLAIQVGVSKEYISMIERGLRSPSLKLANKIAKKLDSTIEQIFFINERTISSLMMCEGRK